jgi:hypothetical protein
MSTKTTFKRVALVAVASLGFGLLSAAPSSAAVAPVALYVSNLSGVGYSSTNAAGTAAIDTAGAITGTGTAFAAADIGKALYSTTGDYWCTIGAVASATAATCMEDLGSAITGTPSFRMGSLSNPGNRVSNPILGTDQISSLTATAGSKVNFVVKSTSGNMADASKLRVAINNVGTLATGSDAVAAGLVNAVNFTAPSVAGTYAMTITYSTDGTDFTDFNAPNAMAISFTLVVSAAAVWSSALSTVHLGTGATAATAATDLLPVSASRTTGTQAANIRVALVNTSGVAYTGQTVTASISGSGFLGAAQTNAAANTADTTSGDRRSTSVTDSNGFVSVTVWPDGTAGKGTVTISVTDKLTLATTVLATKTLTFFGPVAKLTATANYTILAEEGAVTGGGVGGSVATTYIAIENRINATDVPAVIVSATDSAGNPVGGLTIQAVSSAATVAKSALTAGGNSAAGCTADVLSAANLYSSGGTGFYNCALASATTALSGDKATYTFRVLDPADPLGLAYLTATVDVTIGGAVATETLTLDKATYDAGEQMIITRTAVDKKGNPVYDGAASPLVIFNKATGGNAITAGVYVGGKSATSTSRPTVFAPTAQGVFEARMTGKVAGATAQITAKATVGDDAATTAAAAAGDAAAEATDAANAATDAANAAAEAADAATAAAQDAADAVAALSTSVTAMVDALRKQITSLTNLVIKIQKKVRA